MELVLVLEIGNWHAPKIHCEKRDKKINKMASTNK